MELRLPVVVAARFATAACRPSAEIAGNGIVEQKNSLRARLSAYEAMVIGDLPEARIWRR
jgi:hypothetical protein